MVRSLTGTDTVVLVIAGLGFGGAERSALSIASGLLLHGYRVRLVTLADSATAPAYSLPSGLELRQLGLQRASRGLGTGICNNLARLWRIRAAVDDLRAPTVISFVHQTNVLTVLALWGTGARVVVCEETEPSVSAGSAAWDALRRLSYRHAAHVVVRTQAAVGSLAPALRVRALVIPNAVELAEQVADDVCFVAPVPHVLAVGRLEKEKGCDLLIEAFGRVAADHPDWSLCIIGEGAERAALTVRLAALGLSKRVCLPGTLLMSVTRYRLAGLFVSASRRESFGLAIAEAMACGCTVLATNCPSGPGELIDSDHDGLLVPNEDIAALATAMSRLMGDADLRTTLARQASISAKRHAPSRIAEIWRDIVERLRCTDQGQM